MKKNLVFVLALALAATLGIAACATKTETAKTDTEGSAATASTGVANPWSDYATIEEAEKAAGFSITVPDTIDGYERDAIRAMDADMIEVRYTNGTDEVNIRKSIDAYDGDNSGVYGDYTMVDEEVDGHEVDIATEGTLSYVATWTVDGYSYSVYASAGMARDALLDIVAKVA